MIKSILSLGIAIFLALPLYAHAGGLEDGAPLVAAIENCVRQAVSPRTDLPPMRQGAIPEACDKEANSLYSFLKRSDFAKQVAKALEKTDILGSYPYNIDFDSYAIDFARISNLYTGTIFCKNNNNYIPYSLVLGIFIDEIRTKTKDKERVSLVLHMIPNVLPGAAEKSMLDGINGGDRTDYEHWCDKVQTAFKKIPGLTQYFFKG